jgi:hypothetical protein
MPDLSTYTDQRLMQYMAFCTEQSFNYATATQKGRSYYRREVRRIERHMDTRMPVGV